MKKTILLVVLALVMVLSMIGCGAPATSQQPESQQPASQQPQDSAAAGGDAKADYASVKIAQSMPTLNNPWYVLFANGSKDMADALGVSLSQVTNPETNAWAPEEQIKKIENLIANMPDVIEIDPTSSDAINGAIDEAKSQGIDIVMSGTKVTTDVSCSVTADNKQGGILCGEYMGKALDGKGKIAILLGTPGRDVVQARVDGFKEGLAQYDGIEIVAEQVANLDRSEAVTVMENILQANPDIDGVWAANDEMALGAIEALKSQSKNGKVIVGGLDCTPDAIQAIKDGDMHFTADQVPYEMGVRAIGISTLIAMGKEIPATDIQLNMSLVSTENVKEYEENQEANQKAIIEQVRKEYGLN